MPTGRALSSAACSCADRLRWGRAQVLAELGDVGRVAVVVDLQMLEAPGGAWATSPRWSCQLSERGSGCARGVRRARSGTRPLCVEPGPTDWPRGRACRSSPAEVVNVAAGRQPRSGSGASGAATEASAPAASLLSSACRPACSEPSAASTDRSPLGEVVVAPLLVAKTLWSCGASSRSDCLRLAGLVGPGGDLRVSTGLAGGYLVSAAVDADELDEERCGAILAVCRDAMPVRSGSKSRHAGTHACGDGGDGRGRGRRRRGWAVPWSWWRAADWDGMVNDMCWLAGCYSETGPGVVGVDRVCADSPAGSGPVA